MRLFYMFAQSYIHPESLHVTLYYAAGEILLKYARGTYIIMKELGYKHQQL
jgi:hypothetical protein